MRPWIASCALAVLACREATPPASSAPPPTPPAGAARLAPTPPGPRVTDWNALLTEALKVQSLPAGAVALRPDGGLLGVASHGERNVARQPLRPGSTVKPLLAYFAARAGTLGTRAQFTCHEAYPDVEGFTCFDRHGSLDLVHAIQVSCNVYFWDLARRTGLPRIRSGFDDFGLSTPTGLVDDEVPGTIPDDAVLAGLGPDPEATALWPGFSLLVGGGHGPIQVSLLQLTRAYASLAQRLQSPGANEGRLQSDPEVEPAVLAHIDAEILAGLRAVVGDEGTGRAAAVPGVELAGKTGTAEGGHYSRGSSESGTPGNGWFVGFAPAEKPEVVVGVVVLGGGFAGKSAAPIAQTIFATWSDSLRR